MTKSQQQQSTEVAIIQSKDICDYIMEGLVPEVQHDGDVAKAIAMSIMNAGSVEEVDAIANQLKAEDVLGVPLKVNGVSWTRSDYDAGAPVYARINAVRLDTGEPCFITCGGMNVVAQLASYDMLGAFPKFLALTAVDTKSGFKALWLVKVTDPTAMVVSDAEIVEEAVTV